LAESLFVARETEVGRLQEVLELSLAGKGQVCFVTGEAGAGKSTLITEFAKLAQAGHDDLLIAVGNCNAQTGIGDPYLPFREILGQLTGDVESKLAQGAISSENATRLKGFLNVSGRAVVELGPDLIDIFLPGAGLVARASAMVTGESGWRKRLDRLREERASRPDLGLVSRHEPAGGQQQHIFEQFTRLMAELAAQRPLVIVLDDLHWADESSTSLLFHLVRRISDSRVLILGSYRSEDVALGRSERRHPLESVINEIKRLYGDVHLPLQGDDAAQARRFIDAVLDSRPNRLDESFREQLLRHTHGQALFTTELLDGMHKRGDLVEDTEGFLIEGATLDWDAVPARIEGVIEERINRLAPEWQELLTVASVEGEAFCAQVVARVQGLGEREVVRMLDRELDQLHRLVQEDSVKRVGGRRLSHYRFRHNLLQRYLYNLLSRSEREMLHEDFAQMLEELYGEQPEEITGQLARHYDLAGVPDKAASAYLAHGQRALRLFANEEAVDLFSRGLELLESMPSSREILHLTARLQLALGRAQWKLGQAPESMATFEQAALTARQLNSAEFLAEAALGYDDPRFRFNFPTAPAVKLLEEALEALDEENSLLRVRVICALVRAQGHRMHELVRRSLVEHAVAMARNLEDPLAIYTALQTRALANPGPGQVENRLATRDEILEWAERIGEQAPLLDAYVYRIDDLLAVGDIAAVDRDIEAVADLAREVGEPFYDYCVTTKRAMRALLAGRFGEAEQHARHGMDCSQQMEVDNAEGVFGMQMFSIRRLQGQLQGLAPVISHFVSSRPQASCWRPGLALVYAEIGDRAAARQEFETLASGDFKGIPRDSLWQTCLSFLSDVCAFLGDADRARLLYDLAAPYEQLTFVVGNSVACNGAASRSLGRLAAAMSEWELSEQHFQHALQLNGRLRAAPWLAYTQVQYAQMLLTRGRHGDGSSAGESLANAREIAARLGMQGLLEQIGAMQQGPQHDNSV
jgi:tetratricopeptide (TPR) repeat protein